jgi:hypothetical protein
LFQLSNGCCRIELIFVYQLFGVFLTDHCSAVVLRYFLWKTAVLSWGLRGRYTTVHFSSSSAKRLKESDLVRDSANSLFRCHFWKKSFSVFLQNQ